MAQQCQLASLAPAFRILGEVDLNDDLNTGSRLAVCMGQFDPSLTIKQNQSLIFMDLNVFAGRIEIAVLI